MLANLARRFGRPAAVPSPDRRPTITRVDTNRLLVTTVAGPHRFAYYVEADDRLLSPGFIATGQLEPSTTNFLLRHLRPDSHCLDIGARFGYHSCLMARLCPAGRVLGTESDTRLADLARANLFINGLVDTADILSGGESGGLPRLDDLADRLQGRVDFIRIDARCAAPLILATARETIHRNRDIAIILQWAPGQPAHGGLDLPRFTHDIAALGLRCFALEPDGQRPIGEVMLATMPCRSGIILRRIDAR